MAKGRIENLVKNDDLTPEQRRENARKAGKASAEAKKERKRIADMLLDGFHNKVVSKDKLGNELTGADIVAQKIVAGVSKGNYKFITLYLSMIGEKPTDKMELSGSITANAELRSILQQLEGGADGED